MSVGFLFSSFIAPSLSLSLSLCLEPCEKWTNALGVGIEFDYSVSRWSAASHLRLSLSLSISPSPPLQDIYCDMVDLENRLLREIEVKLLDRASTIISFSEICYELDWYAWDSDRACVYVCTLRKVHRCVAHSR
jgi:hypothetical protein